MTTKPKFKSDAFAAIHASASALQKMGAIDLTTMRKFDASCLASSATLGAELPAVVQKHGFDLPA